MDSYPHITPFINAPQWSSMKDSVKFAIGLAASALLIAVSIILLTKDLIGIGVFVALITTSIVVLILPLFFFKGARIDLDGDSLRIEAPMANVDIPFDRIESVRIYEKVSHGIKMFGFNGIRRRSGEFSNAEFGTYTCACDTKVPLYIFVRSGKKKVLFNLGTMESTRIAFDVLRSKVSCDVSTEPYVMTEEEKVAAGRRKKVIIGISVAFGCIICAIIAFVMLTGSVNVVLTDSDVDVEASFMSDFSIEYTDITYIELRNDLDYGKRVIGAANSKVLTGTFNNNEFGKYRLAVNKSVSECVVIHTTDEVYVVNCDNSESTVRMYNELLTKITP